MAEWLRTIREDISKKTEGMDRYQKLEYIAAYYWYHILLTLLGVGIFVLLIRHLFFQEPPKEFICVMINQAVNYDRDEMLQKEFSKELGITEDRVWIDSDYVFSYEGRQIEGANESSYEKFFFRWSVGELDAVIMPLSFYRHCRALEYEFMELNLLFKEELLLDETKRHLWQENLFFEEGSLKAVYLSDTYLISYLNQEEDDPLLLVFLPGDTHREAKQAFLKFAFGA